MWDYQGFEDYDGFAWYRVQFEIPQSVQNDKLFLLLGKIDDVDEAYINGVRVGNTGSIGNGSRWIDRIQDEYQKVRVYRIPNSAIKVNQKNVLAVRVYDKMKFGGLDGGPVGIISEKEYRQWSRNQRRNYQENENTFDRFLQKLFNE